MKYLKNYNTFILEKLYMNFSDKQLTTLIGLNISEICDDYFICSHNELTSLEGAPKEVGNFFDCSYNELTTLKGAPKEVGNFFDCSNNELTSLKYSPIKVGGSFNCSTNKLISLEYTHKYVDGIFECSNNLLTNLDYFPEYIGNDLYCYGNDWAKPIPYKIMTKFNLHCIDNETDNKYVYNYKQFNKFSSFEYQKEFLEREPENYLDLKPIGYAEGIEELFPHLFDMDELGLID